MHFYHDFKSHFFCGIYHSKNKLIGYSVSDFFAKLESTANFYITMVKFGISRWILCLWLRDKNSHYGRIAGINVTFCFPKGNAYARQEGNVEIGDLSRSRSVDKICLGRDYTEQQLFLAWLTKTTVFQQKKSPRVREYCNLKETDLLEKILNIET